MMVPTLCRPLASLFVLAGLASGQSKTMTQSATPVQTYHSLFSIPSSADYGQPILPNVQNKTAVDAQDVCPGYKASNVKQNAYGLTAQLALAGSACNVYGTDIHMLNMTVQYQSRDRLNIEIGPSRVDSTNASHYITSPELLNKPGPDPDAEQSMPMNQLVFSWGNEPSFWLKVARNSSGEELFSTRGNKLVFENQFVEFKSPLPEEYNLYGLGETIHALRLSNNFTKTMYAADIGDPIDE